jgi:hypothetical protein
MEWTDKLKKIGERSPQHLLFVEHVTGCERCQSEVKENLEGYPWNNPLLCEDGSELLQKAESK